MRDEPLVKVVCAIIERSGGNAGDRILAARRGPKQSQAGLWEFPGGKLKEGESEPTGLMREIKEELGIEVIPKVPLISVIHSYPAYTIKLMPFICHISSGEPAAREHSEIKWVNLSDALNLEWAPADIPVVEEYLEIKRLKT